jgi:hypothetical protein
MHILLHVCEYIHMHVYIYNIYISLKTLDPLEPHLLFAQEFQGS